MSPTETKRIVVVGCAGAGKTHFARSLSPLLGAPHIERDRLGVLGSDTYRNAVAEVLPTDRWVFDGPPYFVEEAVYARANLVLWLDYPRYLVLFRAICRALSQTVAPTPPRTGRWRHWLTPGGPLFAARVFTQRRREFSTLASRPELSGKFVRLATPRDAALWREAR